MTKKKSSKVKRKKNSVTSDDATDSDVTYAETDDSELDDEANVHIKDSEFMNEFITKTRQDTNIQREERAKETVTDEMIEEYIVSNEREVEEMEVAGMVTDEMITWKNKRSGLNILSDVVVHTILDEKTGKLKLTPSTNLDASFVGILTTRSNNTLNIPETSKQFVLAKFKSQNGKKIYQYACRIEELFDNKIVVQGLKSKKCKKIFKLVEKDISIIDENDIITYLPNPVSKDDCFIFPHCIQVKEQ